MQGLTVSHRGDRDRAVGKLPVSRDDVGRVPLHGDEHPGIPSGPATVAFPPPGDGRHVLTERAA